MDKHCSTRREFIKTVSAGAAALAMPSAYAKEENSLLVVNPEPRFGLSPYLYMQFMEPLGTTDGSVAAAWDFKRDCWREDVVEVPGSYRPLSSGGVGASFLIIAGRRLWVRGTGENRCSICFGAAWRPTRSAPVSSWISAAEWAPIR